MVEQQKPYQPSEEEIKKAEDMMSPEQEIDSGERQERLELKENIKKSFNKLQDFANSEFGNGWIHVISENKNFAYLSAKSLDRVKIEMRISLRLNDIFENFDLYCPKDLKEETTTIDDTIMDRNELESLLENGFYPVVKGLKK